MEWDYEMSTKRGHMTVKTSNLNDELALVCSTGGKNAWLNRTPFVGPLRVQ